jgi:hypothetical protein
MLPNLCHCVSLGSKSNAHQQKTGDINDLKQWIKEGKLF